MSVVAPRATVRANAKAGASAKPAAPVARKSASVIAARSAFKGASLTAARKAAAPAIRTTTVCRFVWPSDGLFIYIELHADYIYPLMGACGPQVGRTSVIAKVGLSDLESPSCLTMGRSTRIFGSIFQRVHYGLSCGCIGFDRMRLYFTDPLVLRTLRVSYHFHGYPSPCVYRT